MLSFIPQFQENSEVSTGLETCFEERPEQQDVPEKLKEEHLCFIFIVDRSGSMSGTKMETTKEALQLFLKSMPPGTYFDIISFGDTFKHMTE